MHVLLQDEEFTPEDASRVKQILKEGQFHIPVQFYSSIGKNSNALISVYSLLDLIMIILEVDHI